MRTIDDTREFKLRVDSEGRVAIPKEVRDRLGIETDDEMLVRVDGSTLTFDPRPSEKLDLATSSRDDWETPTDAGETLFGELDGR